MLGDVMTDFQLPDEDPAHLLRAREAMLHPKTQYSLRAVFFATLVVALLSLAVRQSSGRAVLDFLPMFSAALTMSALVALLARWTRAEGLAIGGFAAVGALGLLATFPMWMQQGIDESMGAQSVNWERMRFTKDILLPYATWLLVFAVVGGLGMATGWVAALLQRWQRPRPIRVPPGSPENLRFLRARQSVDKPRGRFTVKLLFGLMIVVGMSGWLLANTFSPHAIDLACWLVAIATVLFLLIILRQLSGSDGVAVGGAVFVLGFAVLTMLPIWRYQGSTQYQWMVGYAQLIDYRETSPSMLQVVLFTYLGWLMRFAGYAVFGAITALIAARLPRRRRLELTPLPIEVPPELASEPVALTPPPG
jgi:hypothetical protein